MEFVMRRKPCEGCRAHQHVVTRRSVLLGAAGGLMACRASRADAPPEQDRWPSLAAMIFPDRNIGDGSGVVAIDAPYRAEDAAIVPITLRTVLPADGARRVSRITLIVEANPSPLAAVFTLGAGGGVSRISTRVRVDDYTNIRAVAELSDGQLYGVAAYVKAAGGCSAPALKQASDGIPRGTLRARIYPAAVGDATARPELQVMVRHPNYSGMQMDQMTRLYIPAEFVQRLHISLGARDVLTVESGISISENPAFRFDFVPGGEEDGKPAAFHVEGVDSGGMRFAGSFAAEAAPI
jgi:sulfur-oxidizing protein SoxY